MVKKKGKTISQITLNDSEKARISEAAHDYVDELHNKMVYINEERRNQVLAFIDDIYNEAVAKFESSLQKVQD